MIIKVLIIATILTALVWFLINRNTHSSRAWQKIGLTMLTALGIIVVWSPNLANDIAHKLGVGRGADLLLYVLTLAFIFSLLNTYIKSKDEEKQIVILARHIALLEAQIQNKKRSKKDKK